MSIDKNDYEERADYIEDDLLSKWNVSNTSLDSIQSKLLEKGAKVLEGPRGTGKTHQMKMAYKKSMEDKKKPFAIYVSFSKYYHLEPLLSSNPSAIKIFHTWMLSKIILGCLTSNEKLGLSMLNFYDEITKDELQKFIAQSEKNVTEPWHEKMLNTITIFNVTDFINESMKLANRKRAILLLDDAALTLTKEYMIEFFDVFRSLKTINISPKASVYPGTTEYGPRFHLKQDVDSINMWFNPFEEEYNDFIEEFFQKRFHNISIDENVKSLIKYASFGNPRAFVTILRDYLKNDQMNVQGKFNKIIDERSKLLKDEYNSIKQKLPQYSSILDIGVLFFDEVVDEIVNQNKKILDDNTEETKQVIFGIGYVTDKSTERMIQFLIEAGFLYELTPVKHGQDREYQRYIPHLLFLLQKKAFSKSRGFNIKEIIIYLERPNKKHPIRKESIQSILGEEILDKLKLDLPACFNCGAQRLSENQKFCHNCGSELVSKSTFEECMELTIEELPITSWQKQKILTETSLRTIKDFLAISNISEELTKPSGFGIKKAEKILDTVNILIEEFLA